MSLWKLRTRTQPEAVSELQPQLLTTLIAAGSIGPEHELLPPGWTTWLPLAEARQFLAAASPAQSPGRAASAAAKPAPVRKAEANAAPPTGPGTRPQPPATPNRPSTPTSTPRASSTTSATLVVPASKRPPLKKGSARVQKSGNSSPPHVEGTSQPVRRRRAPLVESDDEELEMTPMIDMTFLLLIFFMVTSTVSAMGKLELPGSTSGDTEDPRDRVVLMLDFEDTARPPNDDRLVGSHEVDERGVRMFLSNKTDRSIPFADLEGVLKSEFAGQATPKFVLQAHRRMPARFVRQAMSSAERAGAVASMVGVSVVRGGP